MSKFKIIGPSKLSGSVKISGAKNSALKLIAASIMSESPSTIHNVPRIKDIKKIEDIIEKTGAKVDVKGSSTTIDPSSINTNILDKELSEKIRASIVLAGPMLARFGEVIFYQPGGDLIGARKIDDHLDVFRQFGIKVEIDDDKYTLKGKPRGGEIILPKISVTATENAIMLGAMAEGQTIIHCGAAEPEIKDLSDYLNSMGATIKNSGHDIEIKGVASLSGCEHTTITDRIEAGTFLMMAIATNSEIIIENVNTNHLSLVLKVLRDSGANFEIMNNSIRTYKHTGLNSYDIDTRTYPGFPTDLQSVYAVYSTQTNGSTRIFETLFESRFAYIEELTKMGANIKVEGPYIIHVMGPNNLNAANINSNDIRGGAALILAALLSQGETKIDNIEQIERGYEKIDEKLRSLGASVERDM